MNVTRFGAATCGCSEELGVEEPKEFRVEEDLAVGIVPLVPLLPLEPFESLDLLESLDDSAGEWSGLKVFERRLRLLKKGILPGRSIETSGHSLVRKMI